MTDRQRERGKSTKKGEQMKRWFVVIGILAFLFIGGYFAFSFYAVKFVQSHLQKVMGPGLTLGEIKVKATHLSVRGIEYEDPLLKQRFFKVDGVRIYPSPLSFLTRSLRIKEITILEPSFFFYRSREGVFVGPWVIEKEKEREKRETPEEEGKKKKKGEALQTKIDRIRIEKGSIDFEDRKMGEPPAQIKLRELDFELRDLRYPLVSSHSPLELKGKIKGPTKEGSIGLKGWVDLKTMDIENSLTFREIDVKTFEPYYRKRATAEIESGYLNMDLKISVNEKKIDGFGNLVLKDFHVRKGGGTVFWIPAETLVSVLEKKGNEIKTEFRVKGDMGDPRFKLQEALLTRVAISLVQALGMPIKVSGEGAQEGTLEGGKGTR